MIVEILRPSAETWDGFALADASATFFQTPLWAQACAAMGVGWRDASLEVVLEDGARILLPRLSRPAARGLFRHLEAMPPGVYGAPLTVGRGLSREEGRAIGALYRGVRVSGAVVVESPGVALDLGAQRELGFSQVLRLDHSEGEEELLRRYRKGHRAAVLNARRRGMVAELATTEEEFIAYHGMYLETAERWDRRPHLTYPARLFALLAALAVRTQRVRLWLVRKERHLQAGAIVLLHGTHAAYWHGASTEQGREGNAGQLAVHAAILDARDRGALTFDFMPSAGLAGVERFKAGFGAEEVSYGIHRFPQSRGYRILEGLLAGRRRAPS